MCTIHGIFVHEIINPFHSAKEPISRLGLTWLSVTPVSRRVPGRVNVWISLKSHVVVSASSQ